jgi:hypothetical protein
MKITNKVNLTPAVNFDEKTGKFQVLLSEVGIFGEGSTRQDAVNNFVETAKDSSNEFFFNYEFYSGFPELMKKFPYYSSIGKCKTKRDLFKLFNLRSKY